MLLLLSSPIFVNLKKRCISSSLEFRNEFFSIYFLSSLSITFSVSFALLPFCFSISLFLVLSFYYLLFVRIFLSVFCPSHSRCLFFPPSCLYISSFFIFSFFSLFVHLILFDLTLTSFKCLTKDSEHAKKS